MVKVCVGIHKQSFSKNLIGKARQLPDPPVLALNFVKDSQIPQKNAEHSKITQILVADPFFALSHQLQLLIKMYCPATGVLLQQVA